MNPPRLTAKRRNRPAVGQPPSRRARDHGPAGGQRPSRRARDHGRLRPVDWALLALIVAAIAVTAVMAIVNPA